MALPSPVHERLAPLCTSFRWKEWAGYAAVASFDTTHEREYFAFRQSAGLLDVSPLHKYEIRGPDAAALLARLLVRDVSRLAVGRVAYSCWCDDDGKVIDDGTVARLADDRFRLTSAEPARFWIEELARGHRVTVEDASATLAALALQGPLARDVLRAASDADLDRLRFFGVVAARLDGRAVEISRTGYTGDLGYEIWVDRDDALAVWDALVAAGRPHGLQPAGLDALDVARIEAGFVLLGCDYFSAPRVVLASRRSTPDELGFAWMVDLARGPFVGRDAIAAERRRGRDWSLVGLEVPWQALEALYDEHGLPPALPARASRDALPVYDEDGRQVGQATSHTWSPLLKRYVALASVRPGHDAEDAALELEHTVEFARRRVPARVVPRPFFDPPRKRAP